MRPRSRAWIAACALLLTLAGCGAEQRREGTASPTPAVATAGATPSPSATVALPAVENPLSLPALMREEFTPGRIRQVSVESRTDAYVRSLVTYGAGDVTVSGVLLRPTGPGPFPGIVLNHGYIE